MKLRMLVVAVISFGFTCAAPAADFDQLQAQGYRWVTVDGPFACTTEQEVQQITSHRTDQTELQMVENLQAYYLTPGTIVQVVKEDRATGMSQIRLGGVTIALWTYTKYLTKRPIKDTYGVVETPENSGLIPTSDTRMISLPDGSAPLPDGSAPLPTSSPGQTMPNNPGVDASSLNPAPSPSPTPQINPRRARGIHHRH